MEKFESHPHLLLLCVGEDSWDESLYPDGSSAAGCGGGLMVNDSNAEYSIDDEMGRTEAVSSAASSSSISRSLIIATAVAKAMVGQSDSSHTVSESFWAKTTR